MSETARVDLGAYSVEVLREWQDITDTLEGEPRPWTLARPDGSGALQFSTRRYRGGAVPDPSLQDLANMVREFGRKRSLEPPTDLVTEQGAIGIAGATYQWQGSLLRIWYLSDGRSFIFVTYVAADGSPQGELSECEAMVRTVRFPEAASGPTRG